MAFPIRGTFSSGNGVNPDTRPALRSCRFIIRSFRNTNWSILYQAHGWDDPLRHFFNPEYRNLIIYIFFFFNR